jgi:hypothetical protein
MVEPITIDMAFVVMLGAALWTMIHLNLAHRSPSSISLTALSRKTALEGLLVAVAWGATCVIVERSVVSDLLLQSAIVGAIWTAFTFVAWLPFRSEHALAK